MMADGLVWTADTWALSAAAVVAAAGLASALLQVRQRRWVDAMLVVLAAAALVALLGDLAVLRSPAGTLTVAEDTRPAAVRAAAALRVPGDDKGKGNGGDGDGDGGGGPGLQRDGLREATWHDLPNRALQWTAPQDPVVTLDFPRQLALGRPFELTLRRSLPLAGWRLQLLDENGKLLAQATAATPGTKATLRWLPPVAETLVLQARVLGADGRVLEHGPVPLQVQAGTPLQVQGRFGAASFDVLALNQLLVGSDALVDWQVTLGKTVTRNETARSEMAAPDLLVIDAAHFERATGPARAALLSQVAQGLPLLVLAANASDAALWARELQLPLVATAGEVTRSPGPDATLVLPLAAWAPAAGVNPNLGPWTANDAAAPWLWQRPWQAGRISWLGVSDWHRAAISAPQALGAWWQTVIDQTGVRRAPALVWDFPDAMPLVGERSRVCARGEGAQMGVEVPGLAQGLHLQRRADSADTACAALWPRQAGWQPVRAQRPAGRGGPGGGDAAAGAIPAPAAFYVYAADDWPQWQRALRREATARYALRAVPALEPVATPLPAWPWALLAGVAMLTLWWRERR
jgi:hypothetical protein